MLVHHPSQHMRPRSIVYPDTTPKSCVKLTFKKRLTQQLNRLLFPCHHETDNSTISSSTITKIEEEDKVDFDDCVIVRRDVDELELLPSLKPPPRPKRRIEARPLESALSQSTIATSTGSSRFDNDHDSDTSIEDDDDEELDIPRVALSVAILPSAVAAATAARSRRYQARVARATRR
ncbi:hypothetical protein BJV82DRAFT_592405 [Fennellomyces sp. T-0311]|nr:hypothetical protein BJV82DRAFT_592405 [Fennellomyces sp. T-0311]